MGSLMCLGEGIFQRSQRYRKIFHGHMPVTDFLVSVWSYIILCSHFAHIACFALLARPHSFCVANHVNGCSLSSDNFLFFCLARALYVSIILTMMRNMQVALSYDTFCYKNCMHLRAGSLCCLPFGLHFNNGLKLPCMFSCCKTCPLVVKL
jgi:hypothetical protein